MMKRIFSLLFVAVACSAAALAQTSLVATLKHGGAISEYYGESALAEAYAAAANGDAITLSSGTFNAVDIEKAITVRGAGMYLTNENPTLLLGTFNINIPVGTSSLTLEGVQCMNEVRIYSNKDNGTELTKLASANILKCYFSEDVRCGNSTPNFLHCVFEAVLSSNRYDMPQISVSGYNTTATCLECAINGIATHGKSGDNLSIINMKNCFINSRMTFGIDYSTFYNCIIRPSSGLASNNIVSNCLCLGGGFNDISKETNTFIEEYNLSSIFKTFTGTFTPHETFELTDQAKAKYKGSDGTQVGIYGGTNPFDPTPTNPQIKKFNVSTSTSGDKLNLKINVE